MKKALLFVSAGLMLASAVNAQTPVIANGSFETWTNVTAPLQIALERPNNWYGSDQIVNHTVGPILMLQSLDFDANKQLSKDTDKHEGTYAAKLMTKDFGDTLKKVPVLMTNAKQTLNMAALAGGLDNLDLMSLFKFSEMTALYGKRIDSVTAYVKTPASNQDPAAAFVVAYKKITSDSMAVIGQGNASIQPNTNGYVKITIPVVYNPVQLPSEATDSMVVGFSSAGAPTGSGYHVDNTLFVDHVELFASDVTSINAVRRQDLGFQVYPNPASTVINFDNKNSATGTTLIIQNTVGQVMHYGKLSNGTTNVDLSQYAAGTYFYEIYNEKGNGKQTGKFVK